jgi:serine/threonine protein kinase
MDSLIGQQLGQYEILSRIGAGGMATVYRARQKSVDRDVAIKVIRSDLMEEADFAERFQREARTIASLSHLHILKVFDYGQEHGLVYLVMELLEGGSLSRYVRSGGPLSMYKASKMLDQIASALDYAHQRGIIHRDLKPDNVLLDKAENAFLTDFGIAKLINETTNLTRTGMVMGTPAYMAPELWSGQSADTRADIYALGVIMFEMLTAKSPFLGDTPFRSMHMHIYEPPPSVLSINPSLPSGLDTVLGIALAKDREARYSSAGLFAESFRALMTTGMIPPQVSIPRGGTMTNPAAARSGTWPPRTLPESNSSILMTIPDMQRKAKTQLSAGELEGQQMQRRTSGRLVLGAVIALLLVGLGILGAAVLSNQQNLEAQGATQTIGSGQTATTAANITATQAMIALLALTPSSTSTPSSTATLDGTALALLITPSATSTSTPTNSPVPSATNTASATASHTPSATPTLTVTPSLTAPPTVGVETLAAQTLAPIQSATALAIQIEQTVNAAIARSNATASAIAVATRAVESTIQAAQTAARATVDAQGTQNANLTATRDAIKARERLQTAAAILTATARAPTKTPTWTPTAVLTVAVASTPVTCEGFMQSRLTVGQYARITPGDPNRLREEPGGRVLTTIPGTEVILVLDGPVCGFASDGEGIAWWNVRWTNAKTGQTYTGWTAEGKGSMYWIDPLSANYTPVAVSTVPAARTPPPNNQRSQAPTGSTRLGTFQVEWYCTDAGYGVKLTNSNRDWACTNKTTGATVKTLGVADFDAICQTWYKDKGAFAIRNLSNEIQAYNWQCYTFK